MGGRQGFGGLGDRVGDGRQNGAPGRRDGPRMDLSDAAGTQDG